MSSSYPSIDRDPLIRFLPHMPLFLLSCAPSLTVERLASQGTLTVPSLHAGHPTSSTGYLTPSIRFLVSPGTRIFPYGGPSPNYRYPTSLRIRLFRGRIASGTALIPSTYPKPSLERQKDKISMPSSITDFKHTLATITTHATDLPSLAV